MMRLRCACSQPRVAVVLLVAVSLGVGCAVQLPEDPPPRPAGRVELAQLWVEPLDLERRDLFYGSGGHELAPEAKQLFHFESEKTGTGFSPGFKVEDERGRPWDVKIGAEARAEVLASRIIWAIGYHQPPNHYLPRWTLERDGVSSAFGDSRFRPEFHPLERKGNWSWHDNPFLETQAFRGLVVLMAVINNWDLTVDNTGIYEPDREWDGARRWYVVRDVGASFSHNRSRLLQGTRGDIEGFEAQPFVRGVENGRVQFDWHGPHRELFENLSTADVRWTCALLARIRPEQWDAAFRAAGYGPQDAARLRATLDERIAQGNSLR